MFLFFFLFLSVAGAFTGVSSFGDAPDETTGSAHEDGDDNFLRTPLYGLMRSSSTDDKPFQLSLLDFVSDGQRGATFGVPYIGLFNQPTLADRGSLFLREIPIQWILPPQVLPVKDLEIKESVVMRGPNLFADPTLILLKFHDGTTGVISSPGGYSSLDGYFEHNLHKTILANTIVVKKKAVALLSVPGPNGYPSGAIVVFEGGEMLRYYSPSVAGGFVPAQVWPPQNEEWYETHRMKGKLIKAHLDREGNLFVLTEYFKLLRFRWSNLSEAPEFIGSTDIDYRLYDYLDLHRRERDRIDTVFDMVSSQNKLLILFKKLQTGVGPSFVQQMTSIKLVEINFGGPPGPVQFRVAAYNSVFTSEVHSPSIVQFGPHQDVAWVMAGTTLHFVHLLADAGEPDASWMLLDRQRLNALGFSVPRDTSFSVGSFAPVPSTPFELALKRIQAEFTREKNALVVDGFPELPVYPTRQAFAGWLESTKNLRFRVYDFYRNLPELPGEPRIEVIADFVTALESAGFRLQSFGMLPFDEVAAQAPFDPAMVLRLFAKAEMFQALHKDDPVSHACEDLLRTVAHVVFE